METIEDIFREVREYGDTPPPRGAWIDIANRIEAAQKAEVAELRQRLKVAEDALFKLHTICEQTEYVYGRLICDDALAAIREKGGD